MRGANVGTPGPGQGEVAELLPFRRVSRMNRTTRRISSPVNVSQVNVKPGSDVIRTAGAMRQ